MKTAVIYARYSSDRQTEQSIEGQVRVCNDYAERNGILIVNQYIDRATTGTNDNREEFQKMLKDSDKKQFDFVLVYKLDRFSRNKFEMAMHRKRLKDNGIKILSAMENIPDSPEGILLESLLEGMNQYYSEELSQKTKRGMKRMRELEEKLTDIEKRLTIEKSQTAFRLSKEQIIDYYKSALEKEPLQLINYFIKEIQLYDDKMIIIYNTPKTINLDESQGFSFYDKNVKMPYVIQNREYYRLKDFRLIMRI